MARRGAAKRNTILIGNGRNPCVAFLMVMIIMPGQQYFPVDATSPNNNNNNK